MVAGGIVLQPNITLYGPDGQTVAAGTPHAKQRCRLGPITLDGPGPYTIVATGASNTAGGYTISLTEV
jgi:hypothetical protein